MKKEKQIRTYQRRTKSGKMVTVKAHTATYDAAEKAKEAAKKKGAGKELESRKNAKEEQLEIPFDWKDEKKVLDEVKETAKKESSKKPAEKKTTVKATRYASGAKLNEDGTFVSEKDYKKSIAHRKKKGARISPEEVKAIKKWESGHKESKVRPVGSGTNGPTPKEKPAKTTSKSDSSAPAFTAAEFKEWYNGTGSAADKKVAKALRAQLGRAGYRKLEDEAIDNYSSRGHLSMFKRVSGGGNTSTTASKSSGTTKVSSSAAKTPKTSTTGNDYSKITNKSLQRKITKYVQEATNWEHSEGARDYTWKDTLRALSDPGEKTVRSRVDKMISGGGSGASTGTKSTTTKRATSKGD